MTNIFAILGLALAITITLSLTARVCNQNKMLKISLYAESPTLRQYKQHLKELDTLSTRAGVRLALTNFQDMYYHGPVLFGKPPQYLDILFDTGSAALWVPSSLLKNNPRYPDFHHTYNGSHSFTNTVDGRNFSIVYGMGKVGGYIVRDYINIAGQDIVNQVFGVATTMDRHTAGLLYDGILGLSFPYGDSLNNHPPVITMVRQGLLDRPVFGISLKPHNSTMEADVMFGGIDEEAFVGPLVFTPVVKRPRWLIRMDRVVVAGQVIASDVFAVPDSGTSLIYAPSHYMDHILRLIKGVNGSNTISVADDGGGSIIQLKCSSVPYLPIITFVINRMQFDLLPNDYIIRDVYNGIPVCISAFVDEASTQINFFLFGAVFMRKYYTAFDMGNMRVGFARSRHYTDQ